MTAADAPLPARLWVYQRERFPLIAHGALTIALAAAASLYAAGISGGRPDIGPIAAGFGLAFLQFALLRIADEHKDIEEDAAHRPYRPVPRGLVSLAELRRVALAAYIAQFLILASLAAAWPFLLWSGLQLYFALMTAEFFFPKQLSRAPILTLFSHMLILPLIAWLAAAPSIAALAVPGWTEDLSAFALAGLGVFALGVALEIARKIRAPQGEEDGVLTYSKLWGRRRAVFALLGACALSIVGLGFAAQAAGAGWTAVMPAFGLLGLAALARPLLKDAPPDGSGKRLGSGTNLYGLTWLAGLAAAGAFATAPI